MAKGLPFELTDYLQLVELTGSCIKEDKRGFINEKEQNILTRLNIAPESWLTLSTEFELLFSGAVGAPNAISEHCHNQKLKRRQNITNSNKLLNTA